MNRISELRATLNDPAVTAALSAHVDPADMRRWDKAKHPADLRRARNEMSACARELNAEAGPGAMTEKASRALDGLLAWVDLLDEQLGLHDEAAAMSPQAGAGEWRDAQGRGVKVFGRTDSVAASNPSSRAGQFDMGDVVRAAALGGPRVQEVRNAMGIAPDSAGGFTVPRDLSAQLIDKLRAKTVCVQAGARTVQLETNETRIVRLAGDPHAVWRAENSPVVESDPGFQAVTFIPKTLAVYFKISRELLEDGQNLAEIFSSSLAGSMAVELDRACMFGSGSANQPLGAANTPGIGTVSLGVNGAALTNYDAFIDGLYELESANVDTAAGVAIVGAPRSMKALRKLKDSTGQPLALPPALAAVPMLATTSVPIDQAHGSASTASTLFVGRFDQLLIGMRTEFRLQVLQERFADNLQVGFLAYLRADVALAQPSAFCAIKGVL